MNPERVIGVSGKLPWHIPEDLKHFRRVTTGHAIIMGRKTYESIGRPLPNRRNIVVSRTARVELNGVVIQEAYRAPEGCEVARSLEAAIELARETDSEPRVIGGAEIYRAALPLATKIYLTEVNRDVNGGDAFFPSFDLSEWIETERTESSTDVVFRTLERAS